MGRLLGKEAYRELLLGVAIVCAALALILWPKEAMAAMKDGLRLCGNVIIPSLFPFFVLSSLVVELGLSRYLGKLFQPVMAPLFRVNGACASAVALGFVGGYPVGARTAIALYQSGQCSKTEAERLLAFCNNAGPAFILGVVGAGVFGSGTVGLLLYLAHIAASLCVGLLFRFYRPHEGPRRGSLTAPQFQAVRFPAAFTRSVTGALSSSLNICAFVLLFCVVIRMLSLAGVLETLAELLSLFLSPSPGQNGCSRACWRSPLGSPPSLTAPYPVGCPWPPSCWAGPACPSTARYWPFWGTAACLCAPTLLVNCSMEPFPPLCWAFSPGWSH